MINGYLLSNLTLVPSGFRGSSFHSNGLHPSVIICIPSGFGWLTINSLEQVQELCQICKYRRYVISIALNAIHRYCILIKSRNIKLRVILLLRWIW